MKRIEYNTAINLIETIILVLYVIVVGLIVWVSNSFLDWLWSSFVSYIVGILGLFGLLFFPEYFGKFIASYLNIKRPTEKEIQEREIEKLDKYLLNLRQSVGLDEDDIEQILNNALQKKAWKKHKW
jgi:energy-coupling factor transporter transmembrane protein EcfT